MKRAKNLIFRITDLNNLYEAFYKASKGKQQKKEVVEYKQNLYENLRLLQHQIQSGQVQVGNYNYFTIYEPKERLICAASFAERVLHHALMNVCHPFFENRQISESYATRIGKGTYKAIEKAKHFCKYYPYYLKLDIRKYFDSISHRILLQILQKMFKDNVLLGIFQQIIESYSTSQKFIAFEKFNQTGLPIGNLTSQYFANLYLSVYDHFIKHELRIKPYVRYMDDFIIWSDNAKQLTKIAEKTELFLQEKLSLSLKIKYINTSEHGLNFLSYRIFNNRTELQQKSKKRFIKKLKQYEKKLETGEFAESDFQRRVTPLIAFTEHASAKGFRKKVLNLPY